MAKKRKYNPNHIKTRHSYSLVEIAEIFNVHPGTVQSWLKQGLNVIDETTKPYLIYGQDVRSFLKDKARKRKHPLKTGEFFCPKCKCPRKSRPGEISAEFTDRKLGNGSNQVFIRGRCAVCDTGLILFSSDRKLKELTENGLMILEYEVLLTGNGNASLNMGIMGRGK